MWPWGVLGQDGGAEVRMAVGGGVLLPARCHLPPWRAAVHPLNVSLGGLTFIPCGELEVILLAISLCSSAVLAVLWRGCLFLSV